MFLYARVSFDVCTPKKRTRKECLHHCLIVVSIINTAYNKTWTNIAFKIDITKKKQNEFSWQRALMQKDSEQRSWMEFQRVSVSRQLISTYSTVQTSDNYTDDDDDGDYSVMIIFTEWRIICHECHVPVTALRHSILASDPQQNYTHNGKSPPEQPTDSFNYCSSSTFI